nr:DUF6701 domain-containing protein [uncultured Tolumonas sp.]
MSKTVSKVITMLLLILISCSAVADVILNGQLDIGDNSYSNDAGYQYKVLSPLSLITNDNKPVNPIHFMLTQDSTITQIVLNGESGILFGVNFVVWNSTGNIVVQKLASNSQVDRISGSWLLSAGDYRIAVWGQCLNSNNMITDDTSCFNNKNQYEWDDISFTSITLVGATSSATNYIQRQHIGDSYEVFNSQSVDRWYPDYPTGLSTIYSLNYSQPSSINRLVIYHFRDWNTLNASRVQIRSKNSGTVLWEHVFTQVDNNTDILLQPQITVAAGEYEVVIDTDKLSDADDLSWDDVIITTKPYTLTYQCSTVFPYPIQGRNNTDYVNLASNKYGYIAGRVWGSQSGKLGYQSSSQILNPGSTSSNNSIVDGNCDNKLCIADKLAGSISLPSSPFPLANGMSFTLDYNQSRILTAADGYNFGTITTNYQSSLSFSVSGITIKNLTIGSDLPGKAYTVKFAAGEYWIENLTMGDSASITLDGNVILHVKNMNMNSANLVNSNGINNGGTVSKLLLVIYDSLYLGNGSTLSGLIYQSDSAASAITLSSASYIYGRINAHNIQFENGSVVNSSSYSCAGTAPAINHYEIRYPSSQITCEPAAITINACTNSDTSSCTKDTTASSSVTLSVPTSGWSSNPVTLINGSGKVFLNHYAVGNVTLGLSSVAYTCFNNEKADSSCQLPFVASAFSFDFPTFYAGGNSSDIRDVTLRALQASATNPSSCTTLFAGKTVNVNFSRQNILPTTVSSKSPILNDTAISTNTPVSLTFDSAGLAHIVLAYQDAGVLGISASYSTTDTTAGTLSISGSDTVAVLPDQIQLTANGQPACKGTDDKTYAACDAYKKVGATFTLSAQAGYGTPLVLTNNFTPENTSVKPLLKHKLVAPSIAAGGTLPDLASIPVSVSAGIATIPVSENDVGFYQYGVTDFVPYPSYQDEATKLTVPITWSAPVGRIIPAQLKATVITNGSLTTDTCANQTSATLGYTDQVLRFASTPMLSVTALDSDGATVMKNYLGAFAKITDMKVPDSASFVAVMIPKNNTNTLTSTASWSDGTWTTSGNAYTHIYTFSANNQFTFGKTNTPVIPFETSLVVSTLTDNDAKATSLPLTFNPMAPDTSTFKVYSGRLTLESVNGAENNGLALPFYMQYWNGSVYAINSADNCTSLTSNVLQMNNQTNWTGIPLRVASATNSVATTTASLSPAKVSSGVGFISFTAPNASGWVDIAASSSLPDWLKDFTLPSGLTPARASFGYYHGNDRLIYRREMFGGQ